MTALAATASTPPRRLTGLPAAAALIGEDLASTLTYAGLYALTHDLRVSLAVGVAAGAGLIAWRLAHGRTVDAMQWASLVLVVVLGGLGLALHEPRFVMLKPSFAYLAVGAVMLKRGWLQRYMPQRVREHGGDIVLAFERLWAGVMFAMAAANLALALFAGPAAWAAFLAVAPLSTKVVLIAAQYATLRIVVRRRVRRARGFTAG